ncbi:MAG: corrinoid protein [Thermodesulfobacteriota bacterium]|nr:corrinoid protein [Thermodesulfobacteriota bacterium]
MNKVADILSQIKESIIEGKYKNIPQLLEGVLKLGSEPKLILNEYMIPAMIEVGNRFEKKEIFIPEMMMSAKAMLAGLEIFEPLLSTGEIELVGTIVIGTVKGDFHDIGKNIVAMMMRGNGINVVDLGVDVPSEKFVEMIKSHKAQLLGMSALLTTTMNQMEQTIQVIIREGLRKEVKIMVGGATLTETFAQKIGADYYAPNASVASRIARDILTKS